MIFQRARGPPLSLFPFLYKKTGFSEPELPRLTSAVLSQVKYEQAVALLRFDLFSRCVVVEAHQDLGASPWDEILRIPGIRSTSSQGLQPSWSAKERALCRLGLLFQLDELALRQRVHHRVDGA